MKPIKFTESNVIFAENQKEYLPLPAWKDTSMQCEVITCWQAGFFDRIKFLFTGKIWFRTLTFNNPLQPQTLTIESPFNHDQNSHRIRKLLQGLLSKRNSG